MAKTYITFGLSHSHNINGKIITTDHVAVIEHGGDEDGREIAFEMFGPKFCMEYPEKHWDAGKMMQYFPKGYVYV